MEKQELEQIVERCKELVNEWRKAYPVSRGVVSGEVRGLANELAEILGMEITKERSIWE